MKIQLVITADEHGVNLAGPVANTALCYGLLEVAKDIVRAASVQAQAIAEQRVVPATVMPPNGHAR